MHLKRIRKITSTLTALLTVMSMLFSAAAPALAASTTGPAPSPVANAPAEFAATQIDNTPFAQTQPAATENNSHAPQADCTMMSYGGYWSTASWSCGHAPGLGDRAILQRLRTPGVRLNQDIEVGSILMIGTSTAGPVRLMTDGYDIRIANNLTLLSGGYYGPGSTISLMDNNHIFIADNITIDNLVMEPATQPRQIGVSGFVSGSRIEVTGDFINGGGPDSMVSFYYHQDNSGGSVFPIFDPVKVSYYCSGNGGIGTIICIPGGPPTAIPDGDPTGLAASAQSATQINVSWTDNSTNESDFVVEWGTSASGPFTETVVPSSDVTGRGGTQTYQHTGLTCDTTYYYRVKARNATGDSATTSVVSATTSPCTPTPPTAPTGGSATPQGQTQIDVTWTDNSTDETDFVIGRSLTPGGPYTDLVDTTDDQAGTGGTQTYNDAGLTCGTTYYYTVRARNANGDSAATTEFSATTEACSPATAHCYTTIDATTVYSSTDSQAVRDAIAAAGVGDVIKIAGMCAGVDGTELANITFELTVQGGYTTSDWMTSDPVAYPTILDAEDAGGVLVTDSPLTVSNLQLQNGNATSGGAIYATANLTITNSDFISNTASTGGAIYATVGMTITDSTFTDNSATVGATGGGALALNGGASFISGSTFIGNNTAGIPNVDGGAIHNAAGSTVFIDTTSFTGNTSSGSAAEGGAINNLGTLFVETSTFSENYGNSSTSGSSWGGGAILNQGDATFTNTTFYSNTTEANGSAISQHGSGTLTLVNSTLSHNNQTAGGSLHIASGTANVINTLIANSNGGSDCAGTLATNNNNLVEDNTCSPAVSGDPRLGPLEQTGLGGTWVLSLQNSSPAIDAGTSTSAPATDQRGVARDANPDIGAYELEQPDFCPGGTCTDLELWLKADAGVYADASSTLAADGDNVLQWHAQAGDIITEAQIVATSNITYNSSAVNFNSAVKFDGTSGQRLAGKTATAFDGFSTIFAVAKNNGANSGADGIFTSVDDPEPTGHAGQGIYYSNDLYVLDGRGANTVNSANTTSSVGNNYHIVAGNYSGSGTTQNTQIYLDGNLEETYAGGGVSLTEGPIFEIGGRTWDHPTYLNRIFNGEIAEVIYYGTQLNTADQNKVESYLALKYGITLVPTQDYVISDTTVWDGTGNAAYHNDVAGIAIDSSSGLTQTQSRSINADSLVIMHDATALDDGEALLWGNDDGAITGTLNVPVGFRRRLERVWRVAKTGNPGDVSVSFDLDIISDTVDFDHIGGFALLVDRDDDFSDATAHTIPTVAGTVVTFHNINLTDDDRFTLAYPLIGDGTTALALSKTGLDVNGGYLREGDDILYTLTVTNMVSLAQPNVVITDAIPANTTYVAGSAQVSQGTITGTNTLVAHIGMLGANASATFSFRVTVDSGAEGQTIENTGYAGGDYQYPDPIQAGPMEPQPNGGTVEPGADTLVLNKTATDVNGGYVRIGDEILYTITVSNPLATAQDVIITDSIPLHTIYGVGSAQVSQGSVSGPDPLVANIGSLAGGTEASLTFTVTVDSTAKGETIENSVLTDSGPQEPPAKMGPVEPAGGGEVTPGQDTLALEKVALDVNGGSLAIGDEIAYVITVTNLLTSTNAGVVITDGIPAHTTYVANSANVSQGNISGTDPLVANIGDMAAGDSVTFTFHVTVDNDAASTTIQNSALADSDTQDPPATVGPVEPQPGGGYITPSGDTLSMSKTAEDSNGAPLNEGDDILYTINVVNLLSEPQSGVVITDPVPAHTTLVADSIIIDQGTLISSDPIVVDLGTLAPNAEANLSFHVTVDNESVGETITNTAQVDSDVQDPVLEVGPIEPQPGGGTVQDKDQDKDGILDKDEDLDGDGDPSNDDSDDDGIPNYLDPDDDNDGIDTKDEDSDNNGDPSDDDQDNDNIPDYLEPNDDDTDNDSDNNHNDADDDGDGVPTAEECPYGPVCPDSDNDGTPNYLDNDDDNDGIDTIDEDLNDNGTPGDDDQDNDGIPDYLEPNTTDTDDNDTNNNLDDDDDGDGIPTATECPNGIPCPDSDNDGTPDYLDNDDDNDGTPTATECPDPTNCPDGDEDGIPDYLEPDDKDTDNDGTPDDEDDDDDGDGIPTADECPDGYVCPDNDGDGIPDYQDDDDDNDGIPTATECTDPDNCADGDNDGMPDYLEPNDEDTDHDGNNNNNDPDDDGDGIPTAAECPDGPVCPDSDGDSKPDYLDDDTQKTLALEKTAVDLNGDTLEIGDEISYLITVTNLLTGTNTGVVITDSIPAHTTYVADSANVSQGSTSGPDPLVANIGNMAAEASATFTFHVTVDSDAAGTTIQNTAQADSESQHPAIEVGPIEPQPGGGTVQPNTGAPIAQTDTYTVPEGIPSTLDVMANDSDSNGNTINLTVINITAVGTPQHGVASTNGTTIVYTPTNGYIGPDSFTYTISDGTATDSADVNITVNPVTDLAAQQMFSTTASGLEVIYTLVIDNLGSRDANGAVVSDTIPAEITGVTWTCTASGGASCTASGSGNLVQDTLTNFPNGGRVVYTVLGELSSNAIIWNTVTVMPPDDVFDLNMSNNTSTRPSKYIIILPILTRENQW